MSYTEITRLGYGRRLTGSLGGAVVGLVLFLVSFILLFWNEGRAITTARSLEEGASAVVSVAADSVNPQYEGKLVHFSGNTSASTLKDPLLGVSAQGVHLNRYVEMFQWYQIEHTA